MFANIVHRYNYIAILILTILTIKLLMIDGQWLIFSVSGTEMVLTFPFCAKKNSKKETETDASQITTDMEQNNDTSRGICTASVILEEFPQKCFQATFPDQISYQYLNRDDIFQDLNVPPPQFSLQVV